ncbi:hypothetical protein [Streptomyces violascens]|uniref:Uncharacterized protein n=1 Tax=Streptomyces violascens TaxID=67381 RepID=A0ABQ3QTL7_9ACTN|nr:hypothetical protein [Streptomyces violascens]GHI40623.1 hypothetical protein Sviol_50310 [Streptomyces violascens]
MVDGITGSVEAYDPNGWDHAAGHAGYVADSVSQALAACALLARYEERFDDGDATARLNSPSCWSSWAWTRRTNSGRTW